MGKKKSDPIQELISDIKEDSKYKQFRTIVKTVQAKVKFDDYQKEALALHAGRESRHLYRKKLYNPQMLIEVSMQDASFRSRLSEMRAITALEMKVLDKAIDTMRKYITTEYYDSLDEFKTVDQRKAMIDRAAAVALELLNEGEALVELLDTLIKDIDSTSFDLQRFSEGLKMMEGLKGKMA